MIINETVKCVWKKHQKVFHWIKRRCLLTGCANTHGTPWVAKCAVNDVEPHASIVYVQFPFSRCSWGIQCVGAGIVFLHFCADGRYLLHFISLVRLLKQFSALCRAQGRKRTHRHKQQIAFLIRRKNFRCEDETFPAKRKQNLTNFRNSTRWVDVNESCTCMQVVHLGVGAHKRDTETANKSTVNRMNVITGHGPSVHTPSEWNESLRLRIISASLWPN